MAGPKLRQLEFLLDSFRLNVLLDLERTAEVVAEVCASDTWHLLLNDALLVFAHLFSGLFLRADEFDGFGGVSLYVTADKKLGLRIVNLLQLSGGLRRDQKVLFSTRCNWRLNV